MHIPNNASKIDDAIYELRARELSAFEINTVVKFSNVLLQQNRTVLLITIEVFLLGISHRNISHFSQRRDFVGSCH